MTRWAADIVEIHELKQEVAALIKVAEAAAYVDYLWGGGRWNAKAIWKLKDALADMPAEKLAIFRTFAEDQFKMEEAAQSERTAKFDRAMAENKLKSDGALIVEGHHNSAETIRRMVLVVSDAVYFRNYTWDRGDEFVNEHPNGRVKRRPGLVTMTCDDLLRKTLHSWDRCDVEITYHRVASSQALRGISGKCTVIRQDGYKPRGKDFDEMLKVLEQ